MSRYKQQRGYVVSFWIFVKYTKVLLVYLKITQSAQHDWTVSAKYYIVKRTQS